jgi:gliding motility-associated protein GldM
MAGYKETPRQKMIAMMYLVLTALLALNVSKEILDAFLVVNESMVSSNETFQKKINDTHEQFNLQYALNPKKVEPFWKKAREAQMLSRELIDYIENVKFRIVQYSQRTDSVETLEKYYHLKEVSDPYNPNKTIEKWLLNLEIVPSKDNFERPTNYFINQGKAKILNEKIKKYKKNILNLVEEKYRDDVKIALETEGIYYDKGGQRQSWEMHNFHMTILAAEITILNKLISEVQTAEFDVVSLLYDQIDISDFKYDQISAKVIPKTNYILKGEKYEAEVLIAACDTKQDPEVYVLRGANEITSGNLSRAQKIEGKEGVVKLEWTANVEGPQKYAGIIKVLTPTGEEVEYPFSHEYIVAPPSLTVAATKMNLFYIGVDNPVSISVPGIAKENIRPSISAGSISSDPNSRGNWIVRVPTGTRKAIISASANYQGQMMNMGSAEFRVKKVPDPVAEIAGLVQGPIEKNTLLAASAIIPEMKDFEFDLYFKVVSFKMITIIGGDLVQKNARGNRFTEDMNNIIKNARRKQKFFFQNIQATGPDGTTRSLNPINLEIK